MKLSPNIFRIFLSLTAAGILVFGFMNCSQEISSLSSIGHEKSELSSVSGNKDSEVIEIGVLPIPEDGRVKQKNSNLISMIVNTSLKSPDWQKEMVIQKEWEKVRETYRDYVKNTKGNAAAIYYVQGLLSAFVQYAYMRNKDSWMLELMDVYLEALNTATKTSQLPFWYPIIKGEPGIPRSRVLPLSRPMKLWLYEDGSENIITSSQFLYPVSLLLLWIAKNDMYDKAPPAKKFFDTYFNIALRDHYLRWIDNRGAPVGAFQVHGWGCGKGNFSHREHLENLLKRRYKKDKSYCNAVLDKDLWILAGVAHLLSVYKLKGSSSEVAMTNKEFKDLSSYLTLGVRLFNSRMTFGSVKDRSGKIRETAVFEKGSFDDHPDHRYSGDTDPAFPGWRVKGQPSERASKPAKGVAWDISHARRLVHFIWSIKQVNPYLKLIKKKVLERIESGLANQLAYRIFNGDLSNPGFSNYFDGTNGWYRVNYIQRPGFGYAPGSWSMGKSIIDGAYGFWDGSNKDVGEIIFHAEKKANYKTSPFICLQVLSAMPSRYFSQLLARPRAKDGSVCN